MKIFHKDINKYYIIVAMAVVSILIEVLLFGYYSFINKLYSNKHLIGNSSTTIEVDALNIVTEPDEWGYKYIEYEHEIENVYNVELVMNKENKDAYIRLLHDNDATLMQKADKEQRIFKAYLGGQTINGFRIAYYADEIIPENIEEIIINDNIDYVVEPSFSIARIVIFFVIMVAIYGFILLLKQIEKKEIKISKVKIFLILGSITGLTLCFANVILSKYDEHAHFWRAYEISDGTIASGHSEGLPSSIFDIVINEDGVYEIEGNTSYQDEKEDFDIDLNPTELTSRLVGASGSASPISYMPQIVGITIARLLKLNPTIIVMFGRIANLAYYLVLIAFAIKLMPKEKWKNITMVIALLPMSMNLAASLSPDSVIISTIILAVAYLLKLKFSDNKIRIKDSIIVGILFMIPTMCKIVYLPLAFMFLMIPKDNFKNLKQKLFYFAIILAIIFGFYFMWRLVPAPNGEIAIRTSTTEQIYYTLTDPIRDIGTLGNTVWYNTEGYIETMIGGWNTPHAIIAIFAIILLLVTYEDSNKDKQIMLNKWERLFALLICLAITALIYGGLYVTWTRAQSNIAEGIQGRYFLPILPVIMVILENDKIKFKLKNLSLKYMALTIALYIPIVVNTVQYFN